MAELKVLILNQVFILRQLQIEEALLKAGEGNFFILNTNSSKAIVMGISEKADEVLNLPLITKDNVPVIRRFSGGGTVVIDQDTIMASFIGDKKDFPFEPYPEPIMRWSASFYNYALKLPLLLFENDYVIQNQKIAGNAQYLRKERWLHHSSFLWDFKPSNMDYLLIPQKQPKYRENRSHTEFLTTLRKHLTTKQEVLEQILAKLKADFKLSFLTLNEAESWLTLPHQKSTNIVAPK